MKICKFSHRLRNSSDFLNDDHNMTKKKRLDSGCYSPRLILSRWLSSLKRSREPGQRRCEKKESEWQRKIATSSEMVESSGRHTKEVSFKLGLGVGLVFLIAATKNEFNKMKELRTQMEIFFKDFKDELKMKDVISKPSESNDNLAYSTNDSQEVGNRNCHLSIQNDALSHHLVVSETTMECDQFMKCNTPRREEFVAGMNQLEAELEAELERLELHLDTEDLLEHPWRKRIENTAPDSSLSVSFEEVGNPHEADSGENFGVSPNELERRLHELLEARQKERITELEFALKGTKNKLHEKEMEVSWWKDTARIISQQYPEAMCLSSVLITAATACSSMEDKLGLATGLVGYRLGYGCKWSGYG
ncbi:hypothetical protein HHK36_021276 [Tetracentron sinense]|uniref:Uncharacterized protein n=1 Tax=Tetracentron sinense TaxID=13715 RepID=A0A834YRT8_TETSI|nr:hypothetical protein HHK36_021276 [Tetracentron sinense]